MAERKERMALLSRYSKHHAAKYEERPSLNMNVEQWAADNLIESYGLPQCYNLLEYYFSVSPSPNWKYFANYTENIINTKKNLDLDLEERAERRRLAKEWLLSE